MSQITIMAAITVIAALSLWGGLIYLFSGRERKYFWLLLSGLPLSAVGNLLIKPQAVIAVGRAGHIPPYLGLMAPIWFLAFKVLVAPLTEEIIKVTPLLLRPARKMVTNRTNAFWVGFALGVSFGLGEALFIAYAISQNGAYASLPWYAYTGYLNERLMTCFAHGVLTAVLVTALQRGGWFILYGYLAATGLHLFLNIPAALYQFQWIPMEVYNFLLVVPFIVLAVVFERLRRLTTVRKKQGDFDEIIYFQR